MNPGRARRPDNAALVKSAGEFQREKRVALRRLVHGPEHRKRKDEAEPFLEQPVQLPEAQALDREPVEPRQGRLRRKRQPRPLGLASAKRNATRSSANLRAAESNTRARPVEPLGVINGDETGRAAASVRKTPTKLRVTPR